MISALTNFVLFFFFLYSVFFLFVLYMKKSLELREFYRKHDVPAWHRSVVLPITQ